MTGHKRTKGGPDVRRVLHQPGSLGFYRILPGRPVAVPLDCWLEGDELCWRTPDPTGPKSPPGADDQEWRRSTGAPRFRTPRQGMLEGFLKLAAASDDQILEFARRWGPLGICEHGLPHTHWPLNTWDAYAARWVAEDPEAPKSSQEESERAREIPCFQAAPITVAMRTASTARVPPDDDYEAYRLAFTRPFCEPCGFSEQHGRGGREPLQTWRRFSEEANAILKLAALLHTRRGVVQAPARLADLALSGASDEPEESDSNVWTDWRWVQSGLARWIGYGNVRPSVVLEGGSPTISLGSANSLVEEEMFINGDRTGFFFANWCGLFGALATQLLLTCQNRGGFAYCTECQSFYEPRRRPRRGERSFCDDCRPKRSKYAARDLRERRRTKELKEPR